MELGRATLPFVCGALPESYLDESAASTNVRANARERLAAWAAAE